MNPIEKAKSSLNFAKAQLEQLCTSDHFTEGEIRLLAPTMALQVRKFQNQYDTLRAKDKEVTEAVPVNDLQSFSKQR